ncbi:hypothetical protein P9112_013055 [Eukaryota sp. TZLM1-RC]
MLPPIGVKTPEPRPLVISNLNKAKAIFIAQKCSIPPLFHYSNNTRSCSPVKLTTLYSTPQSDLETLSENVLRQILQRFKKLSLFLKHVHGSCVLSPTEIVDFINNYISSLKLKKRNPITIQYKRNMNSAFAMTNSTLFIRLPLTRMTTVEIQSVCDHEIGTHFLRSFNHSKQAFGAKNMKKQLKLCSYYEVEEGLAALNTIISWKFKSIFKPCLHYYSCIKAHNLPFLDLFRHLKQFIDSDELCWDEVIRVKRGVGVKEVGVYSKDQVYLRGLIRLLRSRRVINWKKVYSGRLDLRDLDVIDGYYDESLVVMPPFFINEDHYLSLLDQIVVDNNLTEYVGEGFATIG